MLGDIGQEVMEDRDLQLVLFAEPVRSVVGDLGPPLYVASTGAVLVQLSRVVNGSPQVHFSELSNKSGSNAGWYSSAPEN